MNGLLVLSWCAMVLCSWEKVRAQQQQQIVQNEPCKMTFTLTTKSGEIISGDLERLFEIYRQNDRAIKSSSGYGQLALTAQLKYQELQLQIERDRTDKETASRIMSWAFWDFFEKQFALIGWHLVTYERTVVIITFESASHPSSATHDSSSSGSHDSSSSGTWGSSSSGSHGSSSSGTHDSSSSGTWGSSSSGTHGSSSSGSHDSSSSGTWGSSSSGSHGSSSSGTYDSSSSTGHRGQHTLHSAVNQTEQEEY